MKGSSKRVNLLWLSLLWIFWIVWFINLTNGIQIDPPSAESGHVVRLYSLFLWNSSSDTGSVSMKVNEGENFLEMQGWLAVWSGNTVGDNVDSAVIWWWLNNEISVNGKNLWILGWTKNTVWGVNSLIGGWFGNSVSAQNAVVWGWSGNIVSASNGVVIWWEKNRVEGENWVVLWGRSNKANWKNSLVGWYGAEWNNWSFAWSVKAKDNTARIDVNSGMLIWTVTPKNWVRLVINWAVSLAKFKNKDSWTAWEIKVASGCIYAYDGQHWQVMGKASKANCGDASQMCRFWESVLYWWETATGYTNFYSTTWCNKIEVKVVCSGWNLVNNKNIAGTYYPYCYKISN